MAESRRAFLSTVPGIITGVAGMLTAVVGLLTLSVQQGWIGKGSGSSQTSTTVASGPTTTAVGGGTGTTVFGSPATVTPTLTVSPKSLDLSTVGKVQDRVTVRNQGSVVVTLDPPEIRGTDAAQFTVADVSCGGRALQPGADCAVDVKLSASKAGSYTANLVITPTPGSPILVPAKGTRVL